MQLGKVRLLFGLLLVLILGTMHAHAQECGVFDLRTDWSDQANPNGTWAYQDGSRRLPKVDSWQAMLGGWSRPQPGWARSADDNTRLPFWFRSNGTETFDNDFHRCEVVVHTTDDGNGVGSGPATLAWTSPAATNVSVRGAVWMGRDIGRSNDWLLFKNDVLLTDGSIGSGDPYSRSAPFRFEDGSGGPAAVQGIPVAAGDTIRLVVQRTSVPGDFVGVRMKVLCEPVSSTSTTTTTLFYPACGDPVYEQTEGEPPIIITASDALYVLRTAVGLEDCHLCVCDANNSSTVTASDALVVLRVAVGTDPASNCPFCPC